MRQLLAYCLRAEAQQQPSLRANGSEAVIARVRHSVSARHLGHFAAAEAVQQFLVLRIVAERHVRRVLDDVMVVDRARNDVTTAKAVA